jgi:lipopolysaccharide O-acetyltransferase
MTIEFIKRNGLYLFVDECLARCATRMRSFLLARKLKTKRLTIGPRCFLRGLSAMQIGTDLFVAEGLWMEAIEKYFGQRFKPRLVIGNNVTVSRWCHIAATNHVHIGSGVLMGSKVMITDHNHGKYSGNNQSWASTPPTSRQLSNDLEVFVGDNVWLGDGVVVLPGVSIGEGAVIGANSVVVSNIPPFTIAAGVPARVLKVFDNKTGNWKRIESGELSSR